MKKILILGTICLSIVSCNSNKPEDDIATQKKNQIKENTVVSNEYQKRIDNRLPTIGLLMYDGVLQSEVIATSDVFSKSAEDGKQIFNVITIAETEKPILTEEGIRILPDFTFENSPRLTALFVPSAYDMNAQVNNEKIINFIKEKNNETQYVVSNCAGAHLIGKSGIADGYKIVTWIGGGEELQKEYPNLKVQNDSLVRFVEDGKFSSSNGNLVSYVSALNLLEKMTNSEHRSFVESNLYINELRNWKK